jgi:hypothetical protein
LHTIVNAARKGVALPRGGATVDMKAALRPTGGRLGRRNRSTPIFTVRCALSKVHADTTALPNWGNVISSGAKLDPRKAQTVELRLFAGLSVEETAVVLKVSPQSFSALGNRRRPGWPEI